MDKIEKIELIIFQALPRLQSSILCATVIFIQYKGKLTFLNNSVL